MSTEIQAGEPRAPRWRTGLFSLLMIGGVVLVLELLSMLVFYVRLGEPFSYREQQAQRRMLMAVEAASAGGAEDGADPFLGLPLDDVTQAREVLHPFLGYVLNPQAPGGRRRRAGLTIDRRGFLGEARRGERPAEGELEVAVLGGSVAMLFCLQGREHLLERLAELPVLARRPIAVRCAATSGYKQPQQLLTLTYLLALGEVPDVVLNIDGFNELALSYFENYRNQVTPHYPRAWKQRTELLPQRETQWLVGRVVFLRHQRARLAARLSGSALRYTATANLVWRLLDRWIGQDLVDSQLRAAAHVPPTLSYQWQGPFEARPEPVQVLAEQAALWRQSSLQLHRLCAANGIPYFHFLQPNQYLPGSKPMPRGERLLAYDPESPYRWPVEAGYPLLLESAAQLRRAGVRFHDLSGLFEAVEEPLYTDGCCHFNVRGNELLADAIATAIAADPTEIF